MVKYNMIYCSDEERREELEKEKGFLLGVSYLSVISDIPKDEDHFTQFKCFQLMERLQELGDAKESKLLKLTIEDSID